MANRRMYDRRVSFSKKLAAINWQDETVWSRGIPQTDDRGFLPTSDPIELAGLLFPIGKKDGHVPEDQMETSISNLISVGLLEWCTCDIKKCLRYTNFERFQTLKNDRKPLIFCENPSGITGLESNGIQCLPLEAQEVEVEVRSKKKTHMSSRTSDGPRSSKEKEYPEDFHAWYEGYPRKGGKVDAFKAYKARQKEGFSPADLLTARDNYLRKCKAESTELKFHMMAKTFLGPGGHVGECLTLPPPPKTCATCDHGGTDTAYCMEIDDTVTPDRPACPKHAEVKDGR